MTSTCYTAKCSIWAANDLGEIGMAHIALVRLRAQACLQWHLDTRLKQLAAPFLGKSLVRYEALQGQALIPVRILAQWAALIAHYNTLNHTEHQVQIHDDNAQDLSLWRYDWVVMAMDAQNASETLALAKRLIDSGVQVLLLSAAANVYRNNDCVTDKILWANYSTSACMAWLKDLDNAELKPDYINIATDLQAEELCPDWRAHACHDYAPFVVPISLATRGPNGEPTPRSNADILQEIRILSEQSVINPDKCILFDNPWPQSRQIFDLAHELVTLNLHWAATLPQECSQRDIALLTRSGCILALCGQSLSFLSMMHDGNCFDIPSSLLPRLRCAGIICVYSLQLGKDTDSIESLALAAKNITKADIPIAQIFTPYPETAAFSAYEAAGRITTYDWRKYNGQSLVFKPRLLNKHLIESLYHDLCAKIQALPNVIGQSIMGCIQALRKSQLHTRKALALKLALRASSRLQQCSQKSPTHLRNCLSCLVLMNRYHSD